jgi:hypothetical protein
LGKIDFREEPLWLSGKVMEGENKRNIKIPFAVG